jgi:DNA-directed RNA polymerase subunit E'/Rpb7
MFFIVRLKRNVFVAPDELGPLFRRRLELHVRRDVEGQEMHPHGLIIAVVDILGGDRIAGKLLDEGNVKVAVEYDALAFRLEKDEVVDAVVERVAPDGLYCEVGPATVHVPRSRIPDDLAFDAASALVARFVSADGARAVSPGSVVRVRILAETLRHRELPFRAIATMAEQFLGPRA